MVLNNLTAALPHSSPCWGSGPAEERVLHTWLSGMEKCPRLECHLSPPSKPRISGKWLEGVGATWDVSRQGSGSSGQGGERKFLTAAAAVLWYCYTLLYVRVFSACFLTPGLKKGAGSTAWQAQASWLLLPKLMEH